ncbi:MAG: adenosylhomocysteinase [Proteobacteria bacterium]|nr:adenosylhomocysteinase [Pseudomonadota bacterium]
MNYKIKDIKLAERGVDRIEWAGRNMPVLKMLRERYSETKPLEGTRISACLHVTTETANLMILLKSTGAEVALCASNPLSTQDDTAAALVKKYDIPVFAWHGATRDEYYDHILSSLEVKPNITMDDGADLVSTIHKQKRELLKNIIGGSEETTTGVIRLKSMAKDGALMYPMIAVNDSMTKHFFDNRYGTGQSTLDGILRATNFLIAGSVFTVAGYGWCGKGIAKRADGMGANVIVCEVDPVKALEARMDGFRVMPIAEAAKESDIIVTATGDINVVSESAIGNAKDGIIIANSGHFNVEINVDYLEKNSDSKRIIREQITEYDIFKKKVFLLAEGRLVNLSAAEGHPAMVMDMSFANQFYAAKYLLEKGKTLKRDVYVLPEDIDRTVAADKLETLGIKTDKLTEEQKRYLSSWEIGT